MSVHPRRFLSWLGAIVLVGLVIRAASLTAAPVLANDEAALALSIETRDWSGLMKPLEFGQGAPLLFVLASKAAEVAMGAGIWAYRLLPLLAGTAAVLVVGLLARRVLPAPLAIATAALAAAGGPLIQYAAFFKQYSSDALVSAGLLLCLLDFARRSNDAQPAKWPLMLAVICVTAPWLSHPSVFVMAGAGGALLVDLARRGERTQAWRLAMVLAAALASFLVHYVLFARHLSNSTFLQEFWAPQMLPNPVEPLAVVKWLLRSSIDLAATAFGLSTEGTTARAAAAAGLLVAATGLVSLWRRDPTAAWLLAMPVLVVISAAAMRMYPFTGRFLLFTVPTFLILVVCGIRSIARHPAVAALGVGGLSVVMLAGQTLDVWRSREGVDDLHRRVASVCSALAPQLGPNDHVYIFYPNRFVCYYSLIHSGIPAAQITPGAGDSQGAFEAIAKVEDELEQIPSPQWQMVWFVQSHSRVRDGKDEGDVVLEHLRSRCREERTERVQSTRLVGFACGGQPG